MCRSPRDFSKHQEKLTKRVPRDSLEEEAEKQRLRDGEKEGKRKQRSWNKADETYV